MPTRGTTVPLEVDFFTSGGAPVDATAVSLSIYHAETLAAGPFTDVDHGTPGHYSRDWAIPLDAALGTYRAVWSGLLPGHAEPSYGQEDFTVTSFFTGPGFSGCLWPTDTSCLTTEWEAFDEETQMRSLALASSSLHRLTGRRVGGCPIKTRPVLSAASCWFPDPVDLAGRWVNNLALGSYDPPWKVALPGPVGRVDEVKVDGIVLVEGVDYRVNGRYLLRLNDLNWPATQDLRLGEDDEGAFVVTYLRGYEPDALAATAVTLLAVEFGKACTGTGKCTLPKGVRSVVRRGVAYEIQTGLFPNGKTGIAAVDAFLDLWNPKALEQDATVWSPDLPAFR